MKSRNAKLELNRETLRHLQPMQLRLAAGATGGLVCDATTATTATATITDGLKLVDDVLSVVLSDLQGTCPGPGQSGCYCMAACAQ